MKKIFIIDDNEANLFSARKALDVLYETFAAQSAARMFKLLERITPDLILLDVDMPETDGFEALAVLKADERLRSIPVIIRTGTYSDEIIGWDMANLLPSAQLHDIGKIAISDLILNKPGKLTDDEFALIKQHCGVGESILDQIIEKTKNNDFLTHAKRFAGFHHEKWNGKGYPRGLSGLDIPLEGRIMAIADVYDALVSERPYKKAFSHTRAVEIIKNDSGTHFDPKIVEAFLNVTEDFSAQSEMGRQSQ
ncbi:MAG: response regulator [Oscillospiraceae bacterium]|nr:response regulator [Oscillospiraceae bacterium]